MKRKTLLALTVAAGLALPAVGLAQGRTETGTNGGVNENATSTRATSVIDTDAGVSTSTKTRKKTGTVRESHKYRSQKTGNEPVSPTSQAGTTQNATGAEASFPTTREPGHRKSMNSLGKRDALLNPEAETSENSGSGR